MLAARHHCRTAAAAADSHPTFTLTHHVHARSAASQETIDISDQGKSLEQLKLEEEHPWIKNVPEHHKALAANDPSGKNSKDPMERLLEYERLGGKVWRPVIPPEAPPGWGLGNGEKWLKENAWGEDRKKEEEVSGEA